MRGLEVEREDWVWKEEGRGRLGVERRVYRKTERLEVDNSGWRWTNCEEMRLKE